MTKVFFEEFLNNPHYDENMYTQYCVQMLQDQLKNAKGEDTSIRALVEINYELMLDELNADKEYDV